jgi:hypothetical protein
MPAAYVPMVIDQGEDFTSSIIWTDELGEPQQVVAPCRMDVRHAASGQIMLSLQTPEEEVPPGDIPAISLSTEIGTIQLHIPKSVTSALVAGQYQYDFFTSVDDGDIYAGDQVQRILAGPVTVNKRITHL